MKIYKLFLFIFAAAWLTSCGDDDDFKDNTAPDVTVEFGADELVTKEGQTIARIPVILTGNPNGKVRVTLEVTQGVDSETSEPALEDVHYYVTTKTLWIYPDEKEAFFEIAPLNDRDMNKDRQFIVTITNVEYATTGQKSQIVGTIRDNDTEPYDRLTGDWIMNFVYDDEDTSVPFTMSGYLEEDFRYNRILDAVGDWLGQGVSDTITVQFNQAGQYITLMAGCPIVSGVQFTFTDGSPTGPCDILTGIGQSLTGGINGNWIESTVPGTDRKIFSELDFGTGEITLVIRTTADNSVIGGNAIIGTYGTWSNIRAVRPDDY